MYDQSCIIQATHPLITRPLTEKFAVMFAPFLYYYCHVPGIEESKTFFKVLRLLNTLNNNIVDLLEGCVIALILYFVFVLKDLYLEF